jgi:anti-sigma B factor antagonist
VLFDVERTPVAGRPGLTVRGELDMAAAPTLLAAVKSHLASNPGALVVDLSRTTFLDSSGARALLQIAREAAAADVELHVVAPRSNHPVRLTVDLLDLGSAVPLVDSAAEIPTRIAGRDVTSL